MIYIIIFQQIFIHFLYIYVLIAILCFFVNIGCTALIITALTCKSDKESTNQYFCLSVPVDVCLPIIKNYTVSHCHPLSLIDLFWPCVLLSNSHLLFKYTQITPLLNLGNKILIFDLIELDSISTLNAQYISKLWHKMSEFAGMRCSSETP